jgi:hypothetical protein
MIDLYFRPGDRLTKDRILLQNIWQSAVRRSGLPNHACQLKAVTSKYAKSEKPVGLKNRSFSHGRFKKFKNRLGSP